MAHSMSDQYRPSPTATLIDRPRTVAAAYGTRTSEHLFVIDRQGVLVYNGALGNMAVRNHAWMESTGA